MSNVISFKTRRPIPIGQPAAYVDRPSYSVDIYPTPGGFDWDVHTEEDIEPCRDDIAADLAALALSLCPPPRTFLERLRYLFTGDQR